MIGVATIGNATIIGYDDKPIISTDPWIGDEDPAYFGSWVCSHEIPERYKKDILNSEYIWMSHGHPDHINPYSLKRLKGKKILLPDHYGSRIYKDLIKLEYDVEILKEKKWYQLSKNIRIQCLNNWIQDSILLVEVNKRIFVNLNDAGVKYYSRYLRKILKNYEHSYLLSLSGSGDTDMINFFDENGNPIKHKIRNPNVGEQLSDMSNLIGTKNIIPFSSFHQFQREDSIWATEYSTPNESYSKGIKENHNYIEPFVLLNCETGKYEKINPKKLIVIPKKPELFGDNWSDELTKEEFEEVKKYFLSKERLGKILGFIRIKVGGKESTVKFKNKLKTGITFELPRNSLLISIRYRIFDDLLIGNFMKTTLHNIPNLNYKNLKYVIANWSDNGNANTEEELDNYIKSYKIRAGKDFLYYTFLDQSKNLFLRFITKKTNSSIYKISKKIYNALR